MGEFEQWLKSLNENGRVTYFLGQEGKVAKEAWDFQQSKIKQLEQRIDDALGFLVDGYVEHAEQALRGEHE